MVEDAVGVVGHLVGQVDVGVRGKLIVRMPEGLLDDDQAGTGISLETSSDIQNLRHAWNQLLENRRGIRGEGN